MDLSNPTIQAMLGGVIRAILTTLAGAVGVSGLLTGDQLSIVAGSLAAIIGVVWSVYQKSHAATQSHAKLENAVNAAAATPQNASAIIAAAKAGKF